MTPPRSTWLPSRRDFLAASSTALAGSLLPGRALAALRRRHAAAAPDPSPLRIGMLADPHNDLVHDGEERIRVFVECMRREHVDAILQLGDFCTPKPANDRFMEVWRRFRGPRHHVLGNHDMDGGHDVAETLTYWQVERRYRSFDAGGFHFVVLDTNDPPPGEERRGYPAGVRPDQLAWLTVDLAATALPTVVLSHQPLGRRCVRNRDEVLAVLAAAKHAETGRRKVVACFAGHLHADDHVVVDGIHHVIVNSMSYFWLGPPYARIRYSEEVDRTHPTMKFTAPYLDPLFTVVTFDPRGTIAMTGLDSEWVGPSPLDCGFPKDAELVQAGAVAPRISARTLSFEPPAG
ncbi:MAG: metallophosphoesterase [Planctomycetes bacterium]|nr:metallophosphoesterase [Planctomycetota bacterium]